MVARPPAWRRHVPVALLLLGAALAARRVRPAADVDPRQAAGRDRDPRARRLRLDGGPRLEADPARRRARCRDALRRQAAEGIPDGAWSRSPTTRPWLPRRRTTSRSCVLRSTARAPGRRERRSRMPSPGQSRSDGRCPSTKGKRPPAAIVVFSDGGQTAGRVTPQQAAKQAASAHIPVTTVGVGTPDGIVQQPRQGRVHRAHPGPGAADGAAGDREGERRTLRQRGGCRRRQVDVRRARLARRAHAQDGRGDVAPPRQAASCSCSSARSRPASGSGGSCERAVHHDRCGARTGAPRRTSAGRGDERVSRHHCLHPRRRPVGARARRTARRPTCSPARPAAASSAVSTRRPARAACGSRSTAGSARRSAPA